MLHKIIEALVEGHFLKSVFNYIKNTPEKVRKKLDKLFSIPAIYLMSRFTPIEENKIIFITFRGEYDCNAKWISQEILKRDLPYTVVWTIRKKVPVDDIPDSFIKVYRSSYDFYKHLSSAKIIVDNGISTSTLLYKKKKDQILIETWHGSLGIKKFSKDTNKDKNWCMRATIEGRMTDYCISNSTFEDAIYTDTFWTHSRILQLGHARNDILCENGTERLKEIRAKIYEHFEIEEGTRICLYAPTFRDDGDMRPYKIDYNKLREALQIRFGGQWAIFTRFHFRLLKKLKGYKYGDGVINASHYSDIQELQTCADAGITDYSSWICDYMLTRKPGFLFATDMTEYEKKDREFFYPLDSMPFPLAINNNQLIENILTFDNETFVKKCDEFLIDKGCIDDGHSSERIVDAIEHIMRGERI